MLVVIILVTLAVAGRNYLYEAMNRPEQGKGLTLGMDLEQSWWESIAPKPGIRQKTSLSFKGSRLDATLKAMPGRIFQPVWKTKAVTEGVPKEAMLVKEEDPGVEAFLGALGESLPEGCLAMREPGVLVFSPAGMWLFQIEAWDGKIVKQAGLWKRIKSGRDRLGRMQHLEQPVEPAPDEEWQRQKDEIDKILSQRLPQRAWAGSLIQGGVAFSHPKAQLDKAAIQGNTAAYGTTRGWAGRMRAAPAVDEFTVHLKLEILEALQGHAGEATLPAKAEAERLYQAAAAELRQSVAKMVH